MAEQFAELTPEEWKQLALLNCAQLQTFLTNIPPVLESGAPGLSAQHIANVEEHLKRGRVFLRAWASAHANQIAQAPAQQAQPTNGEVPVKRRGGWPAGKPRKPRAEQSAS